MKDLARALRGYKILCFFDLEGTERSHEIIEIGAYKAYLRDDGSIRKVSRPFRLYVKPKHPIGSFVTELTGITEEKVQKEGVSFREMQNRFEAFLGRDYEKTLFVAYGSQDGPMFCASAENNMDASADKARFIQRRTFDFCQFLSHYVQSEKGDPLNLKNACARFGIAFDGQAHDALSDAKNLMDLYAHFLSDKETLKASFKAVLFHSGKMPTPVRAMVRALSEGKAVSPEEFEQLIEDSLR